MVQLNYEIFGTIRRPLKDKTVGTQKIAYVTEANLVDYKKQCHRHGKKSTYSRLWTLRQ